jgi:tripartite-type tricarboxylate transporter receptor subunit TctC
VPNVPTLKELGVDVIYAINRGLLVPKGTPADVRAKLGAACAAATREPGFVDAMKQQGTLVHYLDSKAYADFLKENDTLNKDLARDLGMLKR